jgi:hypothetical protein
MGLCGVEFNALETLALYLGESESGRIRYRYTDIAVSDLLRHPRRGERLVPTRCRILAMGKLLYPRSCLMQKNIVHRFSFFKFDFLKYANCLNRSP